jgi:ribosomal protein S18 acetylase RimI-like enzyme
LLNRQPDIGYTLQADAWLAAHLGKPSWRVESAQRGGPPLASLAGTASFAYAKVAAADVPAVRQLGAHGFFPVDVALTFEGPPTPGGSCARARFARPSDREAVTHIAATTFRYSRFHLDPQIEPRIANAIKAQWAGNFFDGRRGDAMIVAEADGAVAGFLQLLWQAPAVLIIDLIGVGAAHQGRGLARQMIALAMAQGIGAGSAPTLLRVGTQVANGPSIRLYESLGLRLASAQYVLHYHGA